MPKQQELLFTVTFQGKEVKCKAQRGDLVTIGLDGSWCVRAIVKKKVGENAEAAALRILHSTVATGFSPKPTAEPSQTIVPTRKDDLDPMLFSDEAVFLNDVRDLVAARREIRKPVRFVPQAQIRDQCAGSGKRKPMRKQHQQVDSTRDENLESSSVNKDCSNPSCVRSRAEGEKVKQKLERMQSSLSVLRNELDRSCDGLQNAWEVTVVQHLQHALIELLDFEGEGEEELIVDEHQACAPQTEYSNASTSTSLTDEVDTGRFETRAETDVPACIVAAHNSLMGKLTMHEGELLWVEHGKVEAHLRIPILNVSNLTTKKV